MAGLDFYQSQEGVSDARASDIVLPRITDGGQALAGLGESLMRAAEPFARHQAEEAAARDAGIATIVKDPDTGQYIRSAVPKGGLVYTKALNDALDAREANLRDVDFENAIATLALKHSRDPAAFREAAAATADTMLEGAPASLRPQLEARWARSYSEYTRGIGEKVQRETEASLAKAATNTIENSLRAIHQINVANPLGDNSALTNDRIDEALKAINSLADLGHTNAEITSLVDGLNVSMMDDKRFVETAKALADSAPLFAAADTPDKLVVLETWGKGIRTSDKLGGLDFDSYQQRYGPQVGARIGSYAEEKRHELERAAASEKTKEMTPGEILSQLTFQNGGNPAGVPVDQETFARLNVDFLRRYSKLGSSVSEIMAAPGGIEAVAGAVATNGIVPVGTTDAIEKLRGNQGAAAAFGAIALIRQQRFDKYNAGEAYFRTLPTELKSLYSWVEEMHRLGVSDQDINNIDKQKATGQWKALDKGTFSSFKAPDGRNGYSAIRDGAMMQTMQITDPHALDNSRPIWEHEFDLLMEANMNRFDNPRQALNATARTMRSLLVKSPWFWGGIGDSRIFHAGMAPRILDSMAANDPRFKGIKWTDVQPNGQPSVILKNVEPLTYPDRVGKYEVRVFYPQGHQLQGQLASQFQVDMDQLIRDHDTRYAAYKSRHAQEMLKQARPDPWIVSGPEGAHKWVPNPAYQEWLDRQAKLRPAPADREAIKRQGLNRY